MDWMSMVTVGFIRRPHGNRGYVVGEPQTDFGEDRFRVGGIVHVRRGDSIDSMTVVAGRPQGELWVVGFEGFESIDAADALRGLELKVPETELRVLEPGTFYVHDLVGCAVRTVGGDEVGAVVKVDLATGIPVLVIEGAGDLGEVLVPFVDAICRRVRPTVREIEIDPPEGLIELNRTKATVAKALRK
mgnify:CR=1 FL=1